MKGKLKRLDEFAVSACIEYEQYKSLDYGIITFSVNDGVENNLYSYKIDCK